MIVDVLGVSQIAYVHTSIIQMLNQYWFLIVGVFQFIYILQALIFVCVIVGVFRVYLNVKSPPLHDILSPSKHTDGLIVPSIHTNTHISLSHTIVSESCKYTHKHQYIQIQNSIWGWEGKQFLHFGPKPNHHYNHQHRHHHCEDTIHRERGEIRVGASERDVLIYTRYIVQCTYHE